MRATMLGFLFVASVGLAESTNTYYIERYPGDGIKQRTRPAPTERRSVISPLLSVNPEELHSDKPGETPVVADSNATPTKAARYIAPRVSSKDFAPTRKPEGKVMIVVKPDHEKKIPPPPPVTTKPGREAPRPVSTNAPPAAAEPPQ